MMTQRAVRRVLPTRSMTNWCSNASSCRCAPTGNDGQNWEFIVVRDAEVKERLAARYRRKPGCSSATWCCGARSPRTSRWPGSPGRSNGRSTTSPRSRYWWFRVLRLGIADGWLPVVRMPHVAESAYWGSIYPRVQNLLLAARAMGLGASLITLPLWSQSSGTPNPGSSNAIHPICIIPMGWPRGRHGPTTRKPVEEVVHRDTFGEPHLARPSYDRPAG